MTLNRERKNTDILFAATSDFYPTGGIRTYADLMWYRDAKALYMVSPRFGFRRVL